MSDKPNCYKCKYRGEVPGSAHSRCKHPDIGELPPMMGLMSALSGGHTPPLNPNGAAEKLGIKGDQRGIRGGWFGWPMNFDPVWLETCNGFTQALADGSQGEKENE